MRALDAAFSGAVSVASDARPTPRRIFLPDEAERRFEAIAAARDALARPGLRIVAAYSVKTNPRAELLAAALAHGLFAEVISPEELAWARARGFPPERIVFNGPQPLRACEQPIAFVFADSLEAFAKYVRDRVAGTVGVRLRPTSLDSRFGVAAEDDAELAGALARSALEGAGLSFHARRGDFGGATWTDVAGGILERAVALQRRSDCAVTAFDVGGGWTPREFDDLFRSELEPFAGRLAGALPACRTLIFEPGQAIATPCEALVTSVLEVRRRGGRREVVVDAGFSDWPQMHAYAHAVHALRGGEWTRVEPGRDRLAGRTCLEYDRIDGLDFPDDVDPGERLLIANVGSYDRSMAFDFGRGSAVDPSERD